MPEENTSEVKVEAKDFLNDGSAQAENGSAQLIEESAQSVQNEPVVRVAEPTSQNVEPTNPMASPVVVLPETPTQVSEQPTQQIDQPTQTVTPVPVSSLQSFFQKTAQYARSFYTSKKRKKLEKILELLDKKKEVKNDDVEKLLHVSDATATRYLEQLVNEGKIILAGKTSGAVYRKK